MRVPFMPPDEVVGADRAARPGRDRSASATRRRGRPHRDDRATSATTTSSGRRSPTWACRSTSSPTIRRSRSCSSTSARSASSGSATLIPWRNLRAIFGVLRRRELLGLLVDWGYRSDGIPVQLFGAWTTLAGRPGHARGQDPSRILPVDHHAPARRPAPRRPRRADRGRLVGPGRPPARDPGDRRRARRDDPTGTRAVVQLQADLAGDRGRGAPTSSGGRARCMAGRPDPGPAREAAARRGRSGRGGPASVAVRMTITRTPAARRLVAGLPAARRAALPVRRARRRPVVPAGSPAAPPRRGATCGGSAGRWPSPDVASRGCPRGRHRPAGARAPRPLRVPPRRPLLPRGRPRRRASRRPSSTSASRSTRRSSSPRPSSRARRSSSSGSISGRSSWRSSSSPSASARR